MSQLFYYTFRAMGCAVEAALETEADGEALLAALPEQIEAIEARLSRFRPASELSHLNEQSGDWVQVSAVLFQNVALAKHAARITDGLYNPLVLSALVANGYDRSFENLKDSVAFPAPTHKTVGDWKQINLRPKTSEVLLPTGRAIDLGGIAKGWTAALIANRLASFGACLISMGGDIAVRGAPSGQSGWSVKVANPNANQPVCEVMLSNTAIVTSGVDYRRWQTLDGQIRHHIIDPRTGQSAATDVRTVTIIHPDAPTAEAYSKAVLLLGSQAGLNWLTQRWDAAGLVVSDSGTVYATSNWLNVMESPLV